MAEPIEELRESLTGDVLEPSDREYERARLCFNLLIDRRPAAIARCVDADDVATALAFAQANDLEIAVRGGGHNPAGHCAVDDGLVIDLSRMRNVEVDPEAGVAALRAAAPPGSTSTPRPSSTAWSRPAAWSDRPASPASPSAAGSATSPPSTASPATT